MITALIPVYHRIYLAGYSAFYPARWVRKLFARTEFHRAWLTGYMGIYTDTQRRGVCDRNTMRYRKPCSRALIKTNKTS